MPIKDLKHMGELKPIFLPQVTKTYDGQTTYQHYSSNDNKSELYVKDKLIESKYSPLENNKKSNR